MGLCGGGGGDGSEEMRAQEAERQRSIREGTNEINKVFGGPIRKEWQTQEAYDIPGSALPDRYADRQPVRYGPPQVGSRPVTHTSEERVPGQFTDDFYHGLEDTYTDYYKPQLQRQEMDADRALKINLARSGNLTGSVGARQISRLAEDKATQERSLADQSLKYSNDARTRNEQTRGNLVGQLESGAGIENVANQAAAAAATASAPPAFSPLGDLFKNYTAAVANASLAAGNPAAFPGADQYRKQLLFSGGGNNSSTLVN